MNGTERPRGVLSTTIALILLFGSISATAAPGETDAPGQWSLGFGAAPIPAGLSAKYYASDRISFEGVLGTWRPVSAYHDRVRFSSTIGADAAVLHEMPELVSEKELSLHWNYGAAGGIGVANDGAALFGAMGVAGLQFDIKPVPIEFALQYRPGLHWIRADDRGFRLHLIDLAGHLRYRF